MSAFSSRTSVPVGAPGTQSQPQTAPLANGGYVLAWMDFRDDGAGHVHSTVFAQTFGADGVATGAPTQLFGDTAGTANGYVLGGLAGLAGGGYVASANFTTAGVPGTPETVSVVSQQVSASGQLATPDVLTSAVPFEDGSFPNAGEVHALADGGYAVELDRFWKPTPIPGYQTELQRFDAVGTPVGERALVAFGEGAYPGVALLPDGDVATAYWRVSYGPGVPVYWGVMGDDGTAIASGREQATVFTSETRPAVVALSNDSFLVAWHHAPSSSSSAPADPWAAGWTAQLFDAQGQALGGVFHLDMPDVSTVQMTALSDGGFLAWGTLGESVVGRHFGATGAPLGEVFALGSSVNDVEATADGGFLVTGVQVNAGTEADIVLTEFDLVPTQPPPAAAEPIVGGNGTDNLQGTALAELISGGNGKDILFGGLGDDTLQGGNGVDTAVFSGSQADYTLQRIEGGYLLAGPDGTDTVFDIERLQFDDVRLMLRAHGHASVPVEMVGVPEAGLGHAA